MGKIMPLLVKLFQIPLTVFVKFTTNIDFTKQLLKKSEDTDDMACVHRVLSVCYDIHKEVLYKEVLWEIINLQSEKTPLKLKIIRN